MGRDAADRARQSVCAITAAFSAAEKYARAALRALEGWMALATRGRLDARRGEAAVAAFGGPRPRGSLARGGARYRSPVSLGRGAREESRGLAVPYEGLQVK